MADELQTKRIIELVQKTEPEAGDNLAVDNATSGTRRILWENLLDENLADDKKAAPAGAAGRAIEAAKTTLTGQIDRVDRDVKNNSARSNGFYNLIIENGNISLTGEDVDSNTRARTKYAFNNSFILTLANGYKVKNVFRYNYDSNNNPVFAEYLAYNQPVVVFMGGKFIGGMGIAADVFRISISKTDESETISEEEIESIVSSYIPVTTKGVVKLTGMGTSGSAAGATNAGDIYYNTDSKLLRVNGNGAANYYTVPYVENTVYTIGNNVYVWNGTDLVRTDSDVVSGIAVLEGNITALQTETSSIQSNVSALNSNFTEQKTLDFVQGGITLSGEDDNSATATRIRTGYLNIYSYFDFTVSAGYQARIVNYDKGGNFISISDYGNAFSNINGEDYLIRVLVRHADNSNILANEMVLETTYTFDLQKELNTNVLPINYFTPLFGTPTLYASSALEHTEIDSKTSVELFQEYDTLASQYPLFFKRVSDIGVDAYGNAIRAYTLRFWSAAVYEGESGTTNIWDESYNYKTILITSGVHGGEKSASWGLMLAIKEILQSSDNWAQFIKGNLVLKIVPCVNIWGFDNNSRLNYKDINVNRDAYTWASEEGQALKGWYDSNLNAIYYMDIHGTNGERGYQEIWNLSPYKVIHCQNCAKIGASLYYNWVSKFGRNPSFPAIISSFTGLLISYLEAQNVPSSIIEIPRDISNGGTGNYLDSCAFTKDIIINMLQAFGQTAFRAFPIM